MIIKKITISFISVIAIANTANVLYSFNSTPEFYFESIEASANDGDYTKNPVGMWLKQGMYADEQQYVNPCVVNGGAKTHVGGEGQCQPYGSASCTIDSHYQYATSGVHIQCGAGHENCSRVRCKN